MSRLTSPRPTRIRSPRNLAQMAELVDALASGASDRKVVEVRVLFWAPFNQKITLYFKALENYLDSQPTL